METESLTWNTEGKKWQTSQNIKRENRKCKENQETSKSFNISWEVQNDIVFKKQDQNIVKRELFKYKNELLDIKNIWELNESVGFSDRASVMNQPANQYRRHKRRGSILGLGRTSGKGNGNSLQYSCLVNPMDRGAWWATVHGVAKSRTWLKRLSSAQWINRKLSQENLRENEWKKIDNRRRKLKQI